MAARTTGRRPCARKTSMNIITIRTRTSRARSKRISKRQLPTLPLPACPGLRGDGASLSQANAGGASENRRALAPEGGLRAFADISARLPSARPPPAGILPGGLRIVVAAALIAAAPLVGVAAAAEILPGA